MAARLSIRSKSTVNSSVQSKSNLQESKGLKMKSGHRTFSLQKKKSRPNEDSGRASTDNILNNPCKACGKLNHPLYKCDAFQAMNVDERYKLIKDAQLYRNYMQGKVGHDCLYSTCQKMR